MVIEDDRACALELGADYRRQRVVLGEEQLVDYYPNLCFRDAPQCPEDGHARWAIVPIVPEEVCHRRHGGPAGAGDLHNPEYLVVAKIRRGKVLPLGFQGVGKDLLMCLPVMGVPAEGLLAMKLLGGWACHRWGNDG
ncbi:MAG: hypothetical protein RBG13Loki_1417 [Promethearchaeota archaeon CR_4]|nr:MAG: hypothetical protein RBG13Loki_1417 [Candidatus Lokiarchaeota archaeon CR_4]